MCPTLKKPKYDYNSPIFKKNFLYKRLAKEHEALSELDSLVIKVEVARTRGSLKIPEVYHIHYNVNSIVGIDSNQDPIYGDHHVVQISLPQKYPLEPPKIYMLSDAWHPNIKSEGKFKGRICGNTRDFGKGYDLYQLVLRIGEILQYQNYHAIHTPPYPEDANVAEWIVNYAEPNDIVNKAKGITTDDQPLTISQILANESAEEAKQRIEKLKKEQEQQKAEAPKAAALRSSKIKLKLDSARKAPKTNIKISKKD